MSAPENPPAFAAYAETCGQVGMTLRDWFAGMYVSGIHAGDATFLGPEMVADEAYAIADAMLAARAKGEA